MPEALITASKVIKISRTIVSVLAPGSGRGLVVRRRRRKTFRECDRGRLRRISRIAGGRISSALAGVVKRLLDPHQDVGAALGQDRRRARFGVDDLGLAG